MTFTQEEFAQRHERVRAAMAEEGLDAVIAFSTSKVRSTQGHVIWRYPSVISPTNT